MNEQRSSGTFLQQDSAVDWLRLCTLLLAAVSFWATAQGMSTYVFSEGWQAYAASLAVQGILVGLNFYLPSFWRRISGMAKFWLGILTIVVLLCSSWFSFIYIVERVYRNSWSVESRLLVQSLYRRELFSASDYVDAYSEYLNEHLSTQVLSLSERAKKLGTETVNATTGINWEDERRIYTADQFAARNEMSTVIDGMERASGDDASENIRAEVMNAVTTIRANIEDRLERMNQQLGYTEDQLNKAQQYLATARISYNLTASTEGAEAALESALNNLITAQERVSRLQSEVDQRESAISDYRVALQRVQLYETSLGINSEGTSYAVSSYLRDIQRELFQSSPDLAFLESRASSVLSLLQDAMEVANNEGDYQRFFNEMNSFVANLRDAYLIRDIRENLNAMQAELSDTLGAEVDLQEIDPDSVTDILPSDNNAQETEGELPSGDNAQGAESELASGDNAQETEQVSDDDAQGGEAEQVSDDIQEYEDIATVWETLLWRQRLDRLKAQIASLPIYTGETSNPILSSYNRSVASDALDDTIRLYLTNHNAAQQGLIYLASPYRPMAVFSLVLALFLDIAAFVTGILMDGMEQYHKQESGNRNVSGETALETDASGNLEMQEYALPSEQHLNRYLYLNGDYVRLGGKITYRALEDGREIEVNMTEPNMEAGFYVRNGEHWSLVVTPQPLQLVSEPQDGIYFNQRVRYYQNALSIQETASENQYKFLANVPDYLPIYQIINGKMTASSIPISLLPETHGNTLIVALNAAGTVVNAIYIEITEH